MEPRQIVEIIGFQPKDLLEEMFIPLLNKHASKAELTKEQLLAAMGVCHEQVVKEMKETAEFIDMKPMKADVLKYYGRKREIDASEVVRDIDINRRKIDIGSLNDIEFTDEMWNVVRDVRMATHFAMLDVIAKFYAKKHGGWFSSSKTIDKDLWRSRKDRQEHGV